VLGALLLFLKYVEGSSLGTQPKRRKSGKASASSASIPSPVWLLGSAAVYFAALLTKETAIIFPAVILGLGLLVGEHQTASKNRIKTTHQSIRSRLTRVLLQLLPYVCVTAVYLVLRLHALH